VYNKGREREVREMKLHRYVVFAEWCNNPNTTEELDVDAYDRRHARQLAEQQLEALYDPGWKIVRIEGPKVGLYL